MQRLLKSIAASSEEWGVSLQVAGWIALLPIIGTVVVAATLARRPLYRFVTMEDGPLEWSQFVFYALACIAAAGVALRRFRAAHAWQGLLFLGFAVGMFFIAGEEIAWGQRIFGLQTPAQLAAINHQGELTVHNIQIVQNVFNIVLFLGAAYGAAAYFINQKLQVGRYWDQANNLLVPPLFLVPAFLVMFGYKLIRFTVVRNPGFVVTKYGEWPELCIAFAFFMFAWLNYRHLAVATTASATVKESVATH